MSELTSRQLEVLAFIIEHQHKTNSCVKYKDLTEKFGFSKNACKLYVELLIKKGFIVRETDMRGTIRSTYRLILYPEAFSGRTPISSE